MAVKLGLLIVLYILMFLSITKTLHTSDIEMCMPVCWSEATKTVITGTVLLQVWPTLEFSLFNFLLYITMTPALHYTFYKGSSDLNFWRKN